MSDPKPNPEMEQRLERYYASTARPGFEKELEQRLLEAAKTMPSTETPHARNFGRIFQLGLSLAGLALVVIVMIVALQARPDPAAGRKPTHTPTGTVSAVTDSATPQASTEATGTPFSTATPFSVANTPHRLLPGLCPDMTPTPNPDPATAPRLGQPPQAELGGGEAQVNGITFNLRLACDPRFTKESPDFTLMSEFEQLGVFSQWRYTGPIIEGEIATYSGLQPYMVQGGMSGPALSEGVGNDALQGLQFSSTDFVQIPAGDLRFSYVLKLQLPGDQWAGAELRFTLRPESDGYRPVDIVVLPMDEAALTGTTAPEYTLLPTQSPALVDPVLGRLSEIKASWEDQMLNQPGWLYLNTTVDNGKEARWLSNGAILPLVSTEEAWYQTDPRGYVQSSINRQTDLQGNLLQVSTSRDGQYRNLTLGESGVTGSDWRLSVDFGFYEEAVQAVRQGLTISATDSTLADQPTILFKLDYGGYRSSLWVDTASGQPLVYERMVSPGTDQPMELMQRITINAVQRIASPPPDMLALFDATPAPYHAAPAYGTPAPEDFDSSQSYIGMKMIGADSAFQPTFWYGDLYNVNDPLLPDGTLYDANQLSPDSYFLGRVDFGATPGGWCDRSADGSRLAFNWEHPSQANGPDIKLRWFDLSAPGMVHEPDPDLVMNSPVSFAPSGYTLAFFACRRGVCGLYVLETGEADTPARLLAPDLASYAPPTWKPDGTQIASEMLDEKQQVILTIVDARTGKILYQGPRAGSPFESWGVEIVQEQTGFGRCVAP
jgi:hypothetical protein